LFAVKIFIPINQFPALTEAELYEGPCVFFWAKERPEEAPLVLEKQGHQ
jgi:hypothetical protein